MPFFVPILQHCANLTMISAKGKKDVYFPIEQEERKRERARKTESLKERGVIKSVRVSECMSVNERERVRKMCVFVCVCNRVYVSESVCVCL